MSNLSKFTGRISRPIMRLGLKVRAKSPTILLVTGLGSIAAGVAMAVTTAYIFSRACRLQLGAVISSEPGSVDERTPASAGSRSTSRLRQPHFPHAS